MLLAIVISIGVVFANPGFTNYQGRLFDSSGEPLDSGTVELRVKVLSPGAQCTLREEVHSLNMEESSGFFSISVGGGVPAATSPPFTFSQAISNSTTFIDSNLNCAGNSYSPGAADSRVLRVSVNGEDLTPDQVLSSVPYARNSATLEGKTLSELESDYRSHADGKLAGTNLPDIQATPLTAGQSFRWDGSKWEVFTPGDSDLPSNSVTLDDVNFASSEGLNVPQLGAAPFSPVAGQLYYNTSTNKMMVFNGSSWVETGASASPWDVSGADISFASGNVGIGLTDPNKTLQVNGNLDVYSESTFPITSTTTYNADTFPAYFLAYSARGGDKSSASFTQANDPVGFFEGRSLGVSGPFSGAGMRVSAAENHSASTMGSHLALKTVPNGTKLSVDRLTILENGNVGVGTTTPEGALDVSSASGTFIPPRMTEAERDSLISPPNGSVIYNTTSNKMNFRENGSWQEISSGGGPTSGSIVGGGSRQVFGGTTNCNPGWGNGSCSGDNFVCGSGSTKRTNYVSSYTTYYICIKD